MEVYNCQKRCCDVKIRPYTLKKDPYEKFKRRRKKAGIFIYDPESDRVLLVQSRGHLWGPPKGTMNAKESEIDCAVREVREETGLDIDKSMLKYSTRIFNRAIYFYLEMKACEVNIQDHISGNDANGICWIKTDCLRQCIENGNMSISQHCRIIFARFQNKLFPHSTFILVDSQRRSCRFTRSRLRDKVCDNKLCVNIT